MPSILFVSNTANFSKFNKPLISWCKQQKWRVDYCAPDDEIIDFCDNHIVLPIPRNPFSKNVFYCIKEFRKILEENQYDIIHCHTPMGSVIARLAAKKLFNANKIKIIYTAHGFHFYKGAPVKNWILYYIVEKYLSKYTNFIITINDEDYSLAMRKFRKTEIIKLDGVGVNFNNFFPCNSRVEKMELRRKYNFVENDYIILYIAEFIPRKNHKILFEALPTLKTQIPDLKVVLAGKGELLDFYKDKANEMKLGETIVFTGYTKDVADYCRLADLLISTSSQEGLPISIIEGIGTGLPVVASKIRGHIDVIEDGKNGFLFNLESSSDFISAIIKLYHNNMLSEFMKNENIEKSKIYTEDIAVNKTVELYKKLLER